MASDAETTRGRGNGRGPADDQLTGAAPRLYQRAFDILAGQIADGRIEGGSRLQESTVAAQFGISRAPARQALAELQRRGLVEKADGRGYRVRRNAGAGAAVPHADAAEYGRIYEAILTLAWVGARHPRIRLGTSVIVVPHV